MLTATCLMLQRFIKLLCTFARSCCLVSAGGAAINRRHSCSLVAKTGEVIIIWLISNSVPLPGNRARNAENLESFLFFCSDDNKHL